MKRLRLILLISSLALLPAAMQAIFGLGGHDFHQHAASWLDLRDLWRAGVFRAGWAPRANFLLGDPRFCYYPPVSFAIGASLAMMLPFALVPAAFAWVVMAASGASMYFACRGLVAEEDRWKAAVLYVASPYLVTSVLVRFAASEATTLIWLPMAALYFYRAVWQGQLRAILPLGGFAGLTWITNIPASLVLLYVLLTVAVLVSAGRRSPRPVLAFLAAEFTASLLAAFYLAPTWLEQGWIHKDAVLRDSYTNFFLFSPIAHLPVKFFLLSLWLIATVSTGLVLLYGWSGRNAGRETRLGTLTAENAGKLWLAFACVSYFYQLPLAAPLWKYLPELRFVDWPYRFVAPAGVAVPLMLFARATPRVWRKPTYALYALMVLLPLVEYPRTTLIPNFAALVTQWQQVGYRAWPEFVPAEATRPTEPTGFAPVAVLDPAANSPCRASVDSTPLGGKVLRTESAQPCQVRLATYFFPYWRATTDSGSPLAIERDAYGLMRMTVPAGEHTVALKFAARSAPRTASLAVSAVSLILILLMLAFGGRFGARLRPPGSAGQVEIERPNRETAANAP